MIRRNTNIFLGRIINTSVSYRELQSTIIEYHFHKCNFFPLIFSRGLPNYNVIEFTSTFYFLWLVNQNRQINEPAYFISPEKRKLLAFPNPSSIFLPRFEQILLPDRGFFFAYFQGDWEMEKLAFGTWSSKDLMFVPKIAEYFWNKTIFYVPYNYSISQNPQLLNNAT